MEANTWNSITEEMLSNIFAIHRPTAFVFDGSYPYRGMLIAIIRSDDILRIWVRRGSLKKNSSSVPTDSLDIFDSLIHPGDSVDTNINENKISDATIYCDPVVLLDEDEIVASDVLKSRLGIPEDEIVAYVQLGAGKLMIYLQISQLFWEYCKMREFGQSSGSLYSVQELKLAICLM